MKKVLIITYYWPPAGGPGVQRWLKFAKYLPEFGWEPIILTVDENYASYPQKDSSLLDEVSGVEVHKTKSFEILNLYSSLNKDKQVPYGGFSNEGNPSFLKKVSRFIRGNFFIPDPRKGWNSFAYSEAKRIIEEQEIDVVVTTGPPQSTHLIGLKLKKNVIVKKWVADFRDPWTGIFYYNKFYPTVLARKYDSNLEKTVVLNCDNLITTSWSTKNIFDERYGVSDKTHVITNGYDDTDFDGIELDAENRSDEILYAGTISSDYPLQQIIDFAKNSQVFRFKFIGNVNEEFVKLVEKENLSDRFDFMPSVSHNEALLQMSKAGMLLLLIPDNIKNKGIIPGKIFEYLKSNRPVLAFGPEDSDVAKILLETQGDIVGVNNKDKLKFLAAKYDEKFKNGTLSVNSENIAKYSRKNNTSLLVEIINALV